VEGQDVVDVEIDPLSTRCAGRILGDECRSGLWPKIASIALEQWRIVD
jgi:hypothetical protein